MLNSNRIYCRLGDHGIVSCHGFNFSNSNRFFFGVIGISLGYYEPISASLIGFGLHVLTGTIAGNIFGQVSLFWKRVSPYNSKHGLKIGMFVGLVLWIALFVPVAMIVIQPMLDSFNNGITPNQYVYSIMTNFSGLFGIISDGSLIFHLINGILMGYMSGRMIEIGAFQFPKRLHNANPKNDNLNAN